MLLADAAKVSEALRAFYQDYLRDAENRSAHFRKCLDIVRVAVRNADDDLTQLIEMLYPEHSKYPRQFISFRELRDDVCKKLSISPLVWDEALAGKPLVCWSVEPTSSSPCHRVRRRSRSPSVSHRSCMVDYLGRSRSVSSRSARVRWRRSSVSQSELVRSRSCEISWHGLGTSLSVRPSHSSWGPWWVWFRTSLNVEVLRRD